jgi:hypothetical protein
MPGQYNGLFVEYSHVWQKEESEKSTKKQCVANKQKKKYLIPENKKKQFCYLKILANFEA